VLVLGFGGALMLPGGAFHVAFGEALDSSQETEAILLLQAEQAAIDKAAPCYRCGRTLGRLSASIFGKHRPKWFCLTSLVVLLLILAYVAIPATWLMHATTPNQCIKEVRFAHTAGKSLRALPALYAQR
jgi:hypothetical protein